MPSRPARRAQKKTGDNRVRIDIKVDGQTYRFDTADITHRHELALWQQARLTYVEVFNALGSDKPALFMVAALVFLARLGEGDDSGVTFDAIAEALSMDSDIDVQILGDDDDEDRPEAHAGS